MSAKTREGGDRLRSLARLAARQHGIVTSRQLEAVGIPPSTVSDWAVGGRLHRVHRGVYAVGHRRVNLRGRCLAAVFACGEAAAVSHASAAYLWDLLPSLSVPVHVTVPGRSGRRSRPGIRIHCSLLLSRSAVTTRGGIPLTMPERTLRDLKRSAERDLYLRAFRRAVDLRLIEPPSSAADELTRSELERLFLALCRRHRLPAPEVNARVAGFEVDFLWRTERVIVETDGFRFHGDRVAFEDDRARGATLEALGCRVLRFSYRQVMGSPRVVAEAIRRALRPSSNRLQP